MKKMQIIRYIGSKHSISKEIIQWMNSIPHNVYIEVFGGTAGILLNKPRVDVEVYNDINSLIVNLFSVIRDNPEELMNYGSFELYSRELFNYYKNMLDTCSWKNNIEKAYAYYYVMETSFSGLVETFGYSKSRKPFMNKMKKVPLIYERLRGVYIENLDFRELMDRYDTENALFYCDPPYFENVSRKNVYVNEDGSYINMSTKDHIDLLKKMFEY